MIHRQDPGRDSRCGSSGTTVASTGALRCARLPASGLVASSVTADAADPMRDGGRPHFKTLMDEAR